MTTISHGLCTQSFASLVPTANRPVPPCPCALLAPAGCHLQHPLPHPLGNEPSLSISCPEWLSETCRGAFIEVGKLESVSISLAPRFYYFLWSEFQIHQTHLCSNGSMKMHVKIKKKSFLWLSPVLYRPCPCLPALHLLTERSSLSMHKQMARRRTRFPGKNCSEILKVLFLFSILAIHPSEAEVTLIKGFWVLWTFFCIFYDEHILHVCALSCFSHA